MYQEMWHCACKGKEEDASRTHKKMIKGMVMILEQIQYFILRDVDIF